MDVKGEVLVQLFFNKSKLRNGTKTFLEPNFFSTVKFKKLGFSAPLNNNFSISSMMSNNISSMMSNN